MARIVVKERGFETLSVSIREGKITLGRSGKNTIVLKNRYVSGEHCEIACKDGECTLIDLGSTNGVFVNGAKVDTKKLADGDKILAGTALLIHIADENAIQLEELVKQLNEGTAEERELAANLLGQFGTPTIARPLATALKEDPESRVKAAAAEALGFVGDAETVGTLLAFFDTTDTLIRNSIVRAIIHLGDAKAVEGVIAYLKHMDKRVRILAAYTLGQTHSKKATKPLIETLDDEAFAVREAVVKALGDLADHTAAPALARVAGDPERFSPVWAVESLGKIRAPASLPVIMKALKSYDPEVREAAADALGKFRTRKAAPGLIKVLDDPDPIVRKAAAKALEKLRKHLEVERKLGNLASEKRETIEIASIGENEEEESRGVPLHGEDRLKWQAWWAEQSKG
jgi:HEAT repeat protein